MSKTKETGVAAPADIKALAALGQDGIPQLLKQVEAKIKAITGGVKEESSTKGKSFPDFGTIDSVEKVSDLVKMYSAVKNRHEKYLEAAKEMGVELKKFPFKIGGCSAKQWMEDIKSRTIILMNKAELDKLNKIKEKLESNLSAEAKLKKDMEAIGDLLTDDTPLE